MGAVTRDDWYAYDILQVCQRLHEHVSGSGDRLGDDELRNLRCWLQDRADGWKPACTGRFRNYENRVRDLCYAALMELVE